jgi:hypothetical protein
MTHIPRILFALLAAVAVAGCVSRQPQEMVYPPMPPMPWFAPAEIVQDAPQASTLPPRTITIAWDASPDAARVTHYNVYAADVPLLSALQKIGETTNLTWTETADLQSRFYQVTATGTNGLESGWATK